MMFLCRDLRSQKNFVNFDINFLLNRLVGNTFGKTDGQRDLNALAALVLKPGGFLSVIFMSVSNVDTHFTQQQGLSCIGLISQFKSGFGQPIWSLRTHLA